MKLRTLLVPAVLSMALLGAGCDSSANVSGGATPGVPSVTGGAGGSAEASIPSDIPQYPGGVVSLASGAGNLFIYAATTQDSAAQVLAWYEQQFTAAGFKKYGGLDLKTSSSRQYAKGNVSMTFSVIDKSQSQNGQTTFKVSRTTQ